VVTFQRNRVWKDNLSLWSDAVEKSPESAFVHESLAGAFLNGGRIDEAIEHYEVVLENDPKPSARTYNNVGIAYSRKGWTEQAIRSFSRALSVRPDYARAHIGLGIAYYEKGWTDRSIEEFRSAIELDPYLVDAYHNLGVAYRSKGNHREAEEAMKEASRLNPAYYNKR
jgi:tetratricopeptide (TPR) repeat protein